MAYVEIHYAAATGNISRLRDLLNQGVDVNCKCGTLFGGLTPLHCAAFNGRVECIKLLFEYGADEKIVQDMGNEEVKKLYNEHLLETTLEIKQGVD